MDFFHVSTVATLIGTVTITFAYVYLYVVYRERHIGLWSLSLLVILFRAIIFDSGAFDWIQPVFGFTIFQVLMIGSALIFIQGTYLFMNRPLKTFWLYSAISASILSYIFTLMQLPLIYKLFPPAWFVGIACIWMGLTIIRYLEVNIFGKYIIGIALTLEGIHCLDMPFVIEIPKLAPWGYLVDGILKLIASIGILLVYFEKTRSDLANKEAQYRLLAENAIDVIYRYKLKPETKFEYISPSVLAMTGYSPEDYYINPNLLLDLIHPEDQPLFGAFINNPSQSNALPLTFRLIRKDQNVIWIEQKCVAIYDKEENIAALEGILRDVTARINLEQVASRVDRMNMVGNMAATVAHEIRNPITTVRGYLQMLGRKQEFQNNKIKFELMIDELDRANIIICEYLSLAKEKLADLKNLNLNCIVQSLFPLIEADAVAAKVTVNLTLSDIPVLYLDENEIRQLLLNLVRNALEAMPSGGRLSISTFRKEDKAILSISDQGAGIPAHVMEKLGTPFVTTKSTGTGLGLPMCYRIAQRHNASIHIETSAQGTTFFICFNIPHTTI